MMILPSFCEFLKDRRLTNYEGPDAPADHEVNKKTVVNRVEVF